MGQFIVFDTETTSLLKSSKKLSGRQRGGEVIQIAALFLDENFYITRVLNRYCDTTQIIDAGAEKVHKLSGKRVEVLSKNKFFEEIVEEEALRSLTNVTWIGYNISFDIQMVNQTLEQNGYFKLDFGKSVNLLDFHREGIYRFDAMNALCGIYGASRRMKLIDLVSKLIGIDNFKRACQNARSKYHIAESSPGSEDYFHNAFFDALALALLILKCKNFLLE